MSKSNTRRTIGLLFVFVACVALVCADLFVSSARSLPQNSNSSTTQDDETTRGGMMTSNSNSGSTNTNTGNRRRRRNRRNRARAAAAANANMAGGDASMSGDMSGGGQETSGTGMMMENTSGGTQTDLSGTYTGTVNYPEGGLNGPATIVVTGNNFTLTPDGGGTPVNGTVTAVTTRGYTGVTMMFGDRSPIPPSQSPPPLPAVSLRARMSGGRVTLMSVPGEKREFSFAATGASGTGRVRKPRRMRRKRAMKTANADTDRSMDSGSMTIKPPTKTP